MEYVIRVASWTLNTQYSVSSKVVGLTLLPFIAKYNSANRVKSNESRNTSREQKIVFPRSEPVRMRKKKRRNIKVKWSVWSRATYTRKKTRHHRDLGRKNLRRIANEPINDGSVETVLW